MKAAKQKHLSNDVIVIDELTIFATTLTSASCHVVIYLFI